MCIRDRCFDSFTQKIGNIVVKGSGKSENKLMIAIMLVAAILSSISSNKGTTDVIIGICSVAKIPVSRWLMPLAFAAGFGGIMTMIGTPPNIIVTGALEWKKWCEQIQIFK